MMQKSRKKLFFPQTKKCKSFNFKTTSRKQLSNFLKTPKVHFDEKRSIKLTNASNKNAQEAITQCNEGMQNQSNKLIAK